MHIITTVCNSSVRRKGNSGVNFESIKLRQPDRGVLDELLYSLFASTIAAAAPSQAERRQSRLVNTVDGLMWSVAYINIIN